MAKINNKSVTLENFLREKIREAIIEQMISLYEWDPDEWDERGQHGPSHGDIRNDPDTGSLEIYDENENEWISENEWEVRYPEPDLSEHKKSDVPEKNIDSLLSLEFDENKKIQMEYLDKMIKESVKRYFKVNNNKE
jgi:hypothetical protein